MRVHPMPLWIPIAPPPVKKAEKPRKFFHTDEAAELSNTETRPVRPSDILDEDIQEQHTDILA